MKWFKTRQKNRRFRPRHVLKVKLSIRQRRHERFRKAAMLLSVLFAVLLGLFAAWRGGEWMLRHWFYESPAWAIHWLDIKTDGVIAREQLQNWAGVRLEDNLLALDLDRVKRDLELAPIIRSAAVERVLPHTLRIRVKEREPVAQVVPREADEGWRPLYLLDREGYVMFPVEPGQRSTPAPTNDRLPSITGIPLGDLRPGHQVESPQVMAVVQLLEALNESPMVSVVEFKTVDVALPSLLIVTTGHSNEVVFGLADMPGQLRRWRAIHDYAQQNGRSIAWLDLSVSNNIPARWTEATLDPQPPAGIPQPSRLKRKNV